MRRVKLGAGLPGSVILGGLFFGLGVGSGIAAPRPSGGEVNCDLVVLEASTGGVSAALQAAHLGVSTCLTSLTDWVGGQLTTQAVSALDLPYHLNQQVGPKFLNQHARFDGKYFVVEKTPYLAGGAYTSGPFGDEVLRTLWPVLARLEHHGGCWVSSECFRPSEGNALLMARLNEEIKRGYLKYFPESALKKVERAADGSISSIEIVRRRYTGASARPYTVPLSREILDWYDAADSARYLKRSLRLRGKVFMDGSDGAELIALSGAHHDQGLENAEGESVDPNCLLAFVDPINLGAWRPDAADEAYLKSIKAPPGPAFDIHRSPLFTFWEAIPGVPYFSVFDYRRISTIPAVTAVNWNPGNDYATKNVILPMSALQDQMTDWRGGLDNEALDGAERRALAFAAWLGDLPEVTDHGLGGVTPIFDIDSPANFFGTGTGLAKFPYLRETRRLVGYRGFRVKTEDVASGKLEWAEFPDPKLFTNFPDAVGIGSYPFDWRSCATGKDIHYPQPFLKAAQIPLRALVSENVPNLMSANKSWSVSQIVNTGLRTQASEWNAGFGGATAAAVAIRHRMDLHQLLEDPDLIKEAQRLIVRSGSRVLWFSDHIPSDLEKTPSPKEKSDR